MPAPGERRIFQAGRVTSGRAIVKAPSGGDTGSGHGGGSHGASGSTPGHGGTPPGRGGITPAVLAALAVTGGSASQGEGGPGLDPYAAAVLADAPLAYWRLGEASGTVVHDSAGSFTGTYANSPTLGQPGIPGAGGNTAVKMAGLVQSATFGDVLPLTGTKLTIEFWAKFVAAMVNFAPYVARGDNTWRIARDGLSNSNFQFGVGATSTPTVSATGTSFTDGNWHHIVGVYDQTQLLIYFDGAQAAQKAWTTDVPSVPGENVGIGFNSDAPTRTIQAVMDEVAIYNKALSAARVLVHYNKGITA